MKTQTKLVLIGVALCMAAMLLGTLIFGCSSQKIIKPSKPDNPICIERGHYDDNAKTNFKYREFIDDSNKETSYKVTIYTYYSWGICERCGQTFNYRKDADTTKRVIWEKPKTFQQEVDETVNKIINEYKEYK
jgi:hypothetical protein